MDKAQCSCPVGSTELPSGTSKPQRTPARLSITPVPVLSPQDGAGFLMKLTDVDPRVRDVGRVGYLTEQRALGPALHSGESGTRRKALETTPTQPLALPGMCGTSRVHDLLGRVWSAGGPERRCPDMVGVLLSGVQTRSRMGKALTMLEQEEDLPFMASSQEQLEEELVEASENSDTPSSPITHPEKDEIQRSDAQEANDEKVQHFRQMEQEGDLQNRVSEEKQMDQMKEHGNKKREKELQKKFNLTGSEVPIHKVQIQEYLKGGKFNLEVKPDGYVQIDAVKMNNDEIKEINNRISKSPHVMEKIYDDVGLSDISVEHPRKVLDNVECGQCQETTDIKNELEKNRTNTMNCLTKILQKKKEKKVTDESPSQTQQFERGLASNTYDNAISEVTASLISNSQSHLADKESLHEEIYDDVEPDSSGARKKGRIKELGRRFKKEINDGGKEKKIKNKDKAMDHLSVNSRSESTLAIMNLDSERSLYEEISNLKELDDSKDKSSKSDTIKIRWGKIFRKRGENAKRTEDMKLEESEREKVKEKFKVKKKDLNEQTKVNKKKMLNEQDFRENFNYTKEILVENTAVVECNVMQEQKGSLYLPLKLGERLDVIDIGEENLIICRNSEGKYGYVHVQHLSFGT